MKNKMLNLEKVKVWMQMIPLALMLGAVALSQNQNLPTGEGFEIAVLTEKEVAALPQGPLFWRVETFPSLAAAQAAAGDWGLTAEADGKAWLFTLHTEGEGSASGTLMADIGPMPEVVAPSYLLRVNEAKAVPGGSSSIHYHPGAEALYVLSGEVSFRTDEGMVTLGAEQAMAGHTAGTVMQLANDSSTDLHQLVMFIVDSTQPFSSKADFH